MVSRKRQRAERRGRRAESRAALWLQLKGYSILARRVKLPVGEIDLIAVTPRALPKHYKDYWRP